MIPAKLTLSPAQRECLLNPGFILTKLAVQEKMVALMAELSAQYQASIPESFRGEPWVLTGPKIARGEQYEQLPWVMLDYPRYFTREQVLAIRCFCWWGNYASITLQLSGSYMDRYRPAVEAFWQTAEAKDWYWGVGENAWIHDLNSKAYLPWPAQEDRSQQGWLKIAKKIPLEQWDLLPDWYPAQYRLLMDLLQ
jgi:hypothetical protein